MKKLFFIAFAVSAFACTQSDTCEIQDSITIHIDRKGADINPGMYGIFFEEINHSGDGGLVAELVENKSFEDLEIPEGYHVEGDRIITPLQYHHTIGKMVRGEYRWTTEPVPGWQLEGAAAMSLTKADPMFPSAPNSLKVNLTGQAVLKNDGFWGMNLQQGKNYEFRIIVKPCAGTAIVARLLSENGDILAENPIKTGSEGKWNDVSFVLSPKATSEKGSLALAMEGNGTVSFDYVSLMPEERYSYKGGKLPLRKDVADMLIGLHPAFVRWPGGCVVEGISLNNRYEWKKSLGDLAERPGEYDTWGYHNSYGFGYHEMLCFCESIGADAMFVCNVGIGCQARQGDLCGENEIQFYLDDCLDAIEYALGPVDSEWGAVRAKAGHPDPLPLKYVEIGNENNGKEYEKRYNIFHKAIKEKYPELILISNCGLGGIGLIGETNIIDPHWYQTPDFLFKNTHLFDDVERGKYNAYVGEYAANSDVGSGMMLAALSEAAWIGGMERNGDFVKMCSYAPLLENSNDRVWPVNLIWVNSSQVLGRSSYYVQKMAAENRPDYNVCLSSCESSPKPMNYGAGKLSFGTNTSATEFKDVTVTTSDGRAKTIDLSTFDAKKGDWTYAGGVLRQTSLDEATLCTFDGIYDGDYTIDFKFRRTDGAEGCYAGFAMNGDATEGYRFSVAGWDDSKCAIEKVFDNKAVSECSAADVSIIKNGEWQNARIEITDNVSSLYIDGKKIVGHTNVLEPETFYAAGFDEDNSETVLKIVNRSGRVYPLNVTIEGAARIAREGTVITLAAENPSDENSFEDTMKIFPVESTWDGFGKNFTYSLKPYSYTILRIKSERKN
ncbi:MAG: alpha-L-arabinofuranosidase [Alistipes sp.]|nr:alpha-L-arabinofuranosidase [Candidatus Minthomonas equi]